MKKTITATVAFVLMAMLNFSFGRNAVNGQDPEKPQPITTLIINVPVTVMLVDNDQVKPQIVGKNSLTQLVTMEQKGDTLVIGSLKNRNLVNAGVIYVPASSLASIRINADATLRSLQTLQIPKLNVLINGSCYIQVANIGELNMIESEKYVFEQNREVRPLPANFVKNKKY